MDYVSLMLYPSGFHLGIPNYRNSGANTYEIVYLSMKKAQDRTHLPSVRFRPWLQAFRDYAFDRRLFTGVEIRNQIKAAEDFGSDGWMSWNPRNSYTPEPLVKWSFRPNSALCSKFYPRNITYMPAVKFFACLDFERKSSFCKRLISISNIPLLFY